MAVKIVWGIVALLLKIANILIHSIGLYLLRCIPTNEQTTPQLAFIFNLSITELIINVLSFVRNLFKLLPFDFNKSDVFKEVLLYSYFIDYAILNFHCIEQWYM